MPRKANIFNFDASCSKRKDFIANVLLSDQFKPGTVIWVQYRSSKWPAVVCHCYKTQRKVTYQFLPKNSEGRKFSASLRKVTPFRLTDKVADDENKRLKMAVDAALKILREQIDVTAPAETADKSSDSDRITIDDFDRILDETIPDEFKGTESTVDDEPSTLSLTVSDLVRDCLDVDLCNQIKDFDLDFDTFINGTNRGLKRQRPNEGEIEDVVEEIVVQVDDDDNSSRSVRRHSGFML
uniref:PWWP domain-containing protein n=1 Tax=Syphacia muris TaxID=451379 RepID=A0A0N5AX14_9BILA